LQKHTRRYLGTEAIICESLCGVIHKANESLRNNFILHRFAENIYDMSYKRTVSNDMLAILCHDPLLAGAKVAKTIKMDPNPIVPEAWREIDRWAWHGEKPPNASSAQSQEAQPGSTSACQMLAFGKKLQEMTQQNSTNEKCHGILISDVVIQYAVNMCAAVTDNSKDRRLSNWVMLVVLMEALQFYGSSISVRDVCRIFNLQMRPKCPVSTDHAYQVEKRSKIDKLQQSLKTLKKMLEFWYPWMTTDVEMKKSIRVGLAAHAEIQRKFDTKLQQNCNKKRKRNNTVEGVDAMHVVKNDCVSLRKICDVLQNHITKLELEFKKKCEKLKNNQRVCLDGETLSSEMGPFMLTPHDVDSGWIDFLVTNKSTLWEGSLLSALGNDGKTVAQITRPREALRTLQKIDSLSSRLTNVASKGENSVQLQAETRDSKPKQLHIDGLGSCTFETTSLSNMPPIDEHTGSFEGSWRQKVPPIRSLCVEPVDNLFQVTHDALARMSTAAVLFIKHRNIDVYEEEIMNRAKNRVVCFVKHVLQTLPSKFFQIPRNLSADILRNAEHARVSWEKQITEETIHEFLEECQSGFRTSSYNEREFSSKTYSDLVLFVENKCTKRIHDTIRIGRGHRAHTSRRLIPIFVASMWGVSFYQQLQISHRKHKWGAARTVRTHETIDTERELDVTQQILSHMLEHSQDKMPVDKILRGLFHEYPDTANELVSIVCSFGIHPLDVFRLELYPTVGGFWTSAARSAKHDNKSDPSPKRSLAEYLNQLRGNNILLDVSVTNWERAWRIKKMSGEHDDLTSTIEIAYVHETGNFVMPLVDICDPITKSCNVFTT
jgi:hypothetical protein